MLVSAGDRNRPRTSNPEIAGSGAVATVDAVRSQNYLVEATDTGTAPGRHRRWLAHTIELARRSRHKQRMAATAVQGGRVLIGAVNSLRNHPRQVDWAACSRHAEAGLTRADIEGATIYVARIKSDGTTGLARPCRRCMAMLTEAGARQVVWTAGDGTAGLERIRA